MNKNILVITGSPRKGGNSDTLSHAFVKGAEAKGHIVTVFSAASKDIGGCKACDTCWSKGRACSFKDGFTELEPLLEQADSLVFVTPLYWFTFSAQVKAAIDRIYACDKPGSLRPLKIKEAALLVCAGEGKDESVFDGIKSTFHSTLKYVNWQNAGILTVLAVHKKGDIVNTNALNKAKQLGISF